MALCKKKEPSAKFCHRAKSSFPKCEQKPFPIHVRIISVYSGSYKMPEHFAILFFTVPFVYKQVLTHLILTIAAPCIRLICNDLVGFMFRVL